MGQCSCCPNLFSRQKSSDSLSIYTHHPSIQSQLPPDKLKPSKKTELKSMVRQQSAYFNRANKLKLDKQVISTNKIPLIAPRTDQPQLELGNRSDFSYRLKERIKPQINKVSTADEEGSFQNQQFVRKRRMSEQQSESLESPPQNQKAVIQNHTFDFGTDSIVLGIQFRSLPPKTEVADSQHISFLKKKLGETEITVLQQAQTLFQLSKIYFQSKDYNENLSYITKIPPLFAKLSSHLFKFEVISMLGCCQLLLGKTEEAVQVLMKGVRMEVAESGTESIRLVQLYYWLGEAYLRLGKAVQAKQYLTKSLRGYRTHQLDDEELLIAIYLQTGVYYSRQQELVEAEKYFQKGLKLRSASQSAHFPQLLLRRAQNYLCLQHYKEAMRHFSLFFSFLRKHNANNCALWQQGQQCLKRALTQIQAVRISEIQLASVITSANECMCAEELAHLLKQRLKKMRNILYKT